MSERPEGDPRSSVLNAYQPRAGVFGHPQLRGIWQMGTSGHKRAAFHLVGHGNCWLHLRRVHAPQSLQGGDLAVFPRDAWHMLAGMPELHGEENVMAMDGEGPFTTLVCGYFEFQAGDKNPILDALPEVIVVLREDAGRHLETDRSGAGSGNASPVLQTDAVEPGPQSSAQPRRASVRSRSPFCRHHAGS